MFVGQNCLRAKVLIVFCLFAMLKIIPVCHKHFRTFAFWYFQKKLEKCKGLNLGHLTFHTCKFDCGSRNALQLSKWNTGPLAMTLQRCEKMVLDGKAENSQNAKNKNLCTFAVNWKRVILTFGKTKGASARKHVLKKWFITSWKQSTAVRRMQNATWHNSMQLQNFPQNKEKALEFEEGFESTG